MSSLPIKPHLTHITWIAVRLSGDFGEQATNDTNLPSTSQSKNAETAGAFEGLKANAGPQGEWVPNIASGLLPKSDDKTKP